jgi:membrane protein
VVNWSWAWVRVISRRYVDLHGRATAAAITLYGFLALFAVAVLAIAVLGFLSTDNRHIARDLVDWLGVKGAAARTVTDAVSKARESRRLATVVGFFGLVWVGSGFAVAMANAYDTAWRVPQRPTRERLVGLLWLVGAGVLLAAGGFVTAGLGALPAALAPFVLVAGLAVNTLLWLWTAWILPNRRVPWRALLPGALVGAVGLEVLKIVGGYVVPQLVAGSSALYGTLGVVFALLSWLLVFGRLVVIVTFIEVLAWERGHGTDEMMVSGPALMGGRR